MKLRLDKYLCDMGIGTRTEIKALCKSGAVRVNSEITKDSGLKISIPEDSVYVNEQEVIYSQYEYYILNKPQGVLSSTEDKHTKTVLDLITGAHRKDLFPVGRLDKDTEGLLLITNDGMLAHELLSPKKHVDKTYYLETDGLLKDEHIEMIHNGLPIDEDWTTLPATLEILHATTESSAARLTITEGKFHQVKRMMEYLGNHVTFLKRLSMGPLKLPEELACGEYRALTKEEMDSLAPFR